VKFRLVLPFISFLLTGCFVGYSAPGLHSCPEPRPPLACSDIVHPALLSIPFKQMRQGQEDAERWILTEFPTTTIKYLGYDKVPW
jgi:hypothetical protein